MHTLRLLLTRPGELARETDECRDRDAIRPLTLLLLWLTHRRMRKSWLVHVAAAVHYACFAFLVAVAVFAAALNLALRTA